MPEMLKSRGAERICEQRPWRWNYSNFAAQLRRRAFDQVHGSRYSVPLPLAKLCSILAPTDPKYLCSRHTQDKAANYDDRR